MNDYRIRNNNNRLYRIYKGIKQRCLNQNNHAYHNYGGRGITICDEWLNDFDEFRRWSLCNGYDDSLCIDRIDNNGNYEPQNCRWTDRYTQARNTRRNKVIQVNDVVGILKDQCILNNICLSTVQERLKRGWCINRAINENIQPHLAYRNITFNGKTQSVSAWARELNINRTTLRRRLNDRSWSIERALTEPVHPNGRK